MDANAPAEIGADRQHTRAHRRIDWFPIASVGSAALLDLTLMRTDRPRPPTLCVVALLAPSIRDALNDWRSAERYAGERDPIWAVCVLLVHLTATTLALMWIFTTSRWMTGVPRRLVTGADDSDCYRRGGMVRVGSARGASRRSTALDGAGCRSDGSVGLSDRRSTSVGAPEEATSDSDTAGHPTGTSATTARHVAEPADTVTTLASARTVSRAGAPIELTAIVSASGDDPAGRVVFRAGTTVLGSTQLDTKGHASVTVTALPPGEHEIIAEFAGNASFRRSQSPPVSVRIVP